MAHPQHPSLEQSSLKWFHSSVVSKVVLGRAFMFTHCLLRRWISQIQVQPSVLPTSLYCTTSTDINLHQYFDTVNVKAPGDKLPLPSPLPPVQFASFLVSPHDNARQVTSPRKYGGYKFYLLYFTARRLVENYSILSSFCWAFFIFPFLT